MAKGGRYLKKTKKRGWKIALGILLVFILLIGGAAFAGMRYYQSMLDKIPRAEIIEQSVPFEDIQAILDYNPDKPTDEDALTEQAQMETDGTASEESAPAETQTGTEAGG